MTDRLALLDNWAERHPALHRLALTTAFAVRVDPALLRRLRTQLTPSLDAGAEGDLWLSPLTQYRTPDGFVYAPEVAGSLRERLAEEADLYEAAWEVTREAHASLTPALRLEERIHYHAYHPDPAQHDEVPALLRQALAAMVAEDRRGLAAWAARAMAHMPTTVTRTPEAHALHTAATFRLNRSLSPALPNTDALPPDARRTLSDLLHWTLPTDTETVEVGVRLFDNALLFLPAPAVPDAQRLRLPKTNPLVVEVETERSPSSGEEPKWQGEMMMEPETTSHRTTFSEGDIHRLPIEGRLTEIRTLTGEAYEILSPSDLMSHFWDELPDPHQTLLRTENAVEVAWAGKAWDEALTIIERGRKRIERMDTVSLEPSDRRTLQVMEGETHLRREDYDAALETFDLLSKLEIFSSPKQWNGTDYIASVGTLKAYLGMGDLEAIEQLADELQSRLWLADEIPRVEMYKSFVVLGKALVVTLRYEEADSLFQEALRRTQTEDSEQIQQLRFEVLGHFVRFRAETLSIASAASVVEDRLDLAREIGDPHLVAESLLQRAEIVFAMIRRGEATWSDLRNWEDLLSNWDALPPSPHHALRDAEQALDLYERLGDDRAAAVRAQIDAWREKLDGGPPPVA